VVLLSRRPSTRPRRAIRNAQVQRRLLLMTQARPVTRAPSLAGAPIACPLLELGEGRGDGLDRSPGNGHHDTAAPGSCGAVNRQQEDAPQSAS
jgi:hypothetical protein